MIYLVKSAANFEYLEQNLIILCSQPDAVLLPYEDYLRFQQMQESEVLARFDQVWKRLAEVNAAYSEDEITADIQTARRRL